MNHLSTIDVDSLQPGPELDALIAEKWMGWTAEVVNGRCLVPEKGAHKGHREEWSPSTDPAHAGEARRKADCWNLFVDAESTRSKDGIGCHIWMDIDADAFTGACRFDETNSDEGRAEALATSRAIVAALMKAVQVRKGSEVG